MLRSLAVALKDIPSVCRALTEEFARKAGIDVETLWDYLLKRKPAPTELRRQLVETFFPLVSPEDFLRAEDEGLPSSGDNATIDTANQMESTQVQFRGAEPTPGPAKKLRKAGVSIAAWAKRNGVHYSTARSWFQKGDGGRAIPPRYADLLEAEFGIRRDAWPNGVAKAPEK